MADIIQERNKQLADERKRLAAAIRTYDVNDKSIEAERFRLYKAIETQRREREEKHTKNLDGASARENYKQQAEPIVKPPQTDYGISKPIELPRRTAGQPINNNDPEAGGQPGITQSGSMSGETVISNAPKTIIDGQSVRDAYNQKQADNEYSKIGQTITVPLFGKYAAAKQKIKAALDKTYRAAQSAAAFVGARQDIYAPLDFLSDDEKRVLADYATKNDWENAGKYLDSLETDLNARYQTEVSKKTKEMAEKHPVVGTVVNVGGSFAAPGAYLATVGQGIKNAVTGRDEPVDTNSGWFTGAHLTEDSAEGVHNAAYKAAKEATGSELWGNVAAFAADTGLSIAQFASKIPLGQPLALGLMGAGAAGQTAMDVSERGGSIGQAILQGGLSGAVEIITEKIPFDNLLDIVAKTGKTAAKHTIGQTVKEILKQAGVEAVEEAAAEFANLAIDNAVMGDKSEYNEYVKLLVSNGLNEQDARNAATKQFYGYNVLLAAAGGALSGGVLGAAGTATGTLRLNSYDTSVGKQQRDNAPALIQKGMDYAPASETYKLAKQLSEKQNITDTELGRLTRYISHAEAARNRTEFLTDNGVENAQELSGIIGGLLDGESISNKQADTIIDSPAALAYLEKATGTKINLSGTISGQRKQIQNIMDNVSDDIMTNAEAAIAKTNALSHEAAVSRRNGDVHTANSLQSEAEAVALESIDEVRNSDMALDEKKPVIDRLITTRKSVKQKTAEPLQQTSVSELPSNVSETLQDGRDFYSEGDTEMGGNMFKVAIQMIESEIHKTRNDTSLTVEQRKPIINRYISQISQIRAEHDKLTGEVSVQPIQSAQGEIKPIESQTPTPIKTAQNQAETPSTQAAQLDQALSETVTTAKAKTQSTIDGVAELVKTGKTVEAETAYKAAQKENSRVMNVVRNLSLPADAKKPIIDSLRNENKAIADAYKKAISDAQTTVAQPQEAITPLGDTTEGASEKPQETSVNVTEQAQTINEKESPAQNQQNVSSEDKTGIQYSVSDESSDTDNRYFLDLVRNVAAPRGIKVVIDKDSGKGNRPNAYFNHITKEIHISEISTKADTVLLGHEMYHSLDDGDQARIVWFFRTQSNTQSEQFKTFKQERTKAYSELYAQTGREFTEKDFWQEYAAENCETLFTDENYIRRLAGKSKPLAQKVLDFIRDIWHRLILHDTFSHSRASKAGNIPYQALIKAEKMYADALGVKSHSLKIPESGVDVSDNYGYGEVAEVSYSVDETEERTPEELSRLYKQDFVSMPVHGFLDKVKDGVLWSWHRVSRTIADIPESGAEGTFYAMFRNSMIRFRDAVPKSAAEAGRLMDDMITVDSKALSSDEFAEFQKAVYYYDLREEAKKQRDTGMQKSVLPHGLTESEIAMQIDNLRITPNVEKALAKRKETWKKLVKDYIKYNAALGWDVSGKFTREDYYHHQIIDYMKGKESIRFNRNGTVEINTGRRWVKQRGGSERATNTNFISVEYLVLQQMVYDTEVAKMLSGVKAKYDIKPQLVESAKTMNQSAIDDIILDEATQAAINSAEQSLGRELSPTERANIEPEFTTRGDKSVPASSTYEALNVFNKRMAIAVSKLSKMAKSGAFDNVPGKYREAVNMLRNNELGAPVFSFMSYLASGTQDDDAKISALMFLGSVAKKEKFIRQRLGNDYQTWETILAQTPGYTKYQPRSGQHVFVRDIVSIPQTEALYMNAAQELLKGKNISRDDMQEVISEYSERIKQLGMPYETWVVPNTVHRVLSLAAQKKQPNPVANVSRQMLAAWKGWVTSVNPMRAFKYGMRNLAGDLDAVVTGNPAILKKVPQAVTDIFHAMVRNERSPLFAEWADLGGMTNLIQVQEIDSESVKKVFNQIKVKPDNAWDLIKSIPGKYVNGMQNVQEFREAILRYAAYLHFKDAVKSGTIDFTASNRDIVRGLDTPELKAYQLSKDLLGAYDEISAFGRTVRQHMIPFYSFIEANLKRYYRLYANPVRDVVEDFRVNRKAIPKDLAKFMYRTAAANALMALMTLVNRVINRDEDDKLPEDVKARPHFTFGQIGDNIITFNRLGNISEMLEWVGYDDLEFTDEDIYAPVDKIWSSLTPFIKTPVELLMGKTFYPEFAHPKNIRDRWEYFFDSLGVADVYDAVSGKPSGKTFADVIKGSFVYSYDYKTAAYWDIMDVKYDFQQKADISVEPTRKANALYYMKQAIRYGDAEKVIKYMDEYFAEGGTAKGLALSMATMNPLYGFTSEKTQEKGQAFVASLDDIERDKLRIACDYYKQYLEIPEPLAEWLRKKTTTEAEAVAYLTKHFKGQASKNKSLANN